LRKFEGYRTTDTASGASNQGCADGFGRCFHGWGLPKTASRINGIATQVAKTLRTESVQLYADDSRIRCSIFVPNSICSRQVAVPSLHIFKANSHL
jgi:hypothetical protein